MIFNFTEFEKSLKELNTPNLYNQIIKQNNLTVVDLLKLVLI